MLTAASPSSPDSRRLAAGRISAWARIFAWYGSGRAVQRGQRVVRGPPHVQFVKHPAAGRGEIRGELVAAQPDLLAAVEVVVPAATPHHRFARPAHGRPAAFSSSVSASIRCLYTAFRRCGRYSPPNAPCQYEQLHCAL